MVQLHLELYIIQVNVVIFFASYGNQNVNFTHNLLEKDKFNFRCGNNDPLNIDFNINNTNCYYKPLIFTINTTNKEVLRFIKYNFSILSNNFPKYPKNIERLFTPIPEPENWFTKNSTLIYIILISVIFIILLLYIFYKQFNSNVGIEDEIEDPNYRQNDLINNNQNHFSQDNIPKVRLTANHSRLHFGPVLPSNLENDIKP